MRHVIDRGIKIDLFGAVFNGGDNKVGLGGNFAGVFDFAVLFDHEIEILAKLVEGELQIGVVRLKEVDLIVLFGIGQIVERVLQTVKVGEHRVAVSAGILVLQTGDSLGVVHGLDDASGRVVVNHDVPRHVAGPSHQGKVV